MKLKTFSLMISILLTSWFGLNSARAEVIDTIFIGQSKLIGIIHPNCYSYSWNTGQTTSQITVNPYITTMYVESWENVIDAVVSHDTIRVVVLHPVIGTAITEYFTSQTQNTSVIALGVNKTTTSTEHINIFPNPAKDKVNLTGVDSKDILSIKILNVLGETIYTTTSIMETMHIDISHYASGTYFISFISADGLSKSKRLMKK